MILKNIEIKNFRNYSHLKLNLGEKINIIYGDNGVGKTNILESIYMLAFAKSHRSFIDDNLIKENEEKALIKGTILDKVSYNLEINLNKTTKEIKIDGNHITKIGNYIEKMNVIIFYSDDLNLIKGFPSNRRKYLDMQISQISKNYYNALSDYNKLLKIRNDYLKQMSEQTNIDKNYFNILTDYIVEKSLFIYQMRIQYIKKLNDICPKIFENIANKKNFHIQYLSSVNFTNLEKKTIKKELKEALTNNLSKEIKYKTTMYGPHRDDFEFKINNSNVKNYGSQGQQRMAVLALKLSEIQIIKDYKHTTPIILLDDVFSELDFKKKNNLLSYIDQNMQVVITTTDLENISEKIINKSKIIKIEAGNVKEEV